MPNDPLETKTPRIFIVGANDRRSVPPLERMLAIARQGCSDADKLSKQDIEDLSKALLVQYAQLGIG